MSGINLQPFKTMGSMGGLFNVSSRGFTQGDAQDDPAVRMQLCSGLISDDVETPLYAGMGVLECLAPADSVTGNNIILPTATRCNAFTVINQAYHGITTPNSPVPQFLQGGSVHYFRIGSLARIPLPISADVAAMVQDGGPVDADGFVWDLVNQCVDVYSSGSSGNPVVNIKLLQVSTSGNLTVKKDNGNLVWDTEMPCGLFLI